MTARPPESCVLAKDRPEEPVVPVVSPGPLVPVADFGPLDRLRGWIVTGLITLLATVTRFLNLGSLTDAGTPIFDEKHYAPQAWQVLNNHGVEDNPGYGLVVHPPVGKQLIAIGEAIFGYNGFGWRFTGALLGVLLVALVVRIVRRISRSTLVGAIAGVLLGLACATKWSGVYFVLFFGAMALAFDVAARRQYQVQRPWLGTVRRDVLPSGYALGLIPFAVYLATYAPWFASETAIDRHAVGQAVGRNSVVPLPDAVRSLWHYTAKAFHFHAGLTNSAGNYHPWESKPWTWPMSLRPVLYAIDQQDVAGCGAQSCVKAEMLVGTPAMWWLAVPVLAYAGWRMFVRRDWRYAVVLVGYCAGWLPWFADIDRQMYFFYAATMAPFLVMGISLVLGDILYHPGQGSERRTLGADRRLLLRGPRGDELCVAVSGAHRSANLTTDLEPGDLAAQLAVICGAARRRNRHS